MKASEAARAREVVAMDQADEAESNGMEYLAHHFRNVAEEYRAEAEELERKGE